MISQRADINIVISSPQLLVWAQRHHLPAGQIFRLRAAVNQKKPSLKGEGRKVKFLVWAKAILIFYHLSRLVVVYLNRQANFPIPVHLLQLIRGNAEIFPSRPRNIKPAPGPKTPRLGGVSAAILVRRSNHLNRLYSESLSNDQAPHPTSKGEPSQPSKETHFWRLYRWPHSLGHYPDLVTIGDREV